MDDLMTPEYYFQADRDRAKAQASPIALSYIEALEKVAKDAYALWSQLGTADQQVSASDLYDSLTCVNFMQDED
jgi:hypothetical protein